MILTIRAVLVRTPDLSGDDFEPFDPELFLRKLRETKPEAKEAEPTPAEGARAEPAPAKKATRPATDAKAVPAEAPAAPAKKSPPAAEAAAEAKAPVRTEDPASAKDSQQPAAGPAAPIKPPAPAPATSDLYLYLSPLNEHMAKGERLRLNVLVSGGKGISEGSLQMQVDPKLKVLGIGAGDFVANEGGSLEQLPGKSGGLTVNFRRSGSATDSGALFWLEVEALQSGNAPILIQGGKFMIGTNPISGRWMNALVTVE